MGKRRFKQLGVGSFFDSLVFDRAVPETNFLRQLGAIVPWDRFTERLTALYQGRAERGRPPYDPVVILKMLILSYLYDLSERQTEVFANDSLSGKCFLGLAVDEPAPDHSTLTAFKKRIIENGQIGELEAPLVEIVRVAQEQGVEFGQIQVVDSTHTVANVNTGKDDRRRKNEERGPVIGGHDGEPSIAVAIGPRRGSKDLSGVFLWLQGAYQHEHSNAPNYQCGSDSRECAGRQAIRGLGGQRRRAKPTGAYLWDRSGL